MAAPTVTKRGNPDALDYAPSVAVSAGDVVLEGSLVGVAQCDIAASGPIGSYEIEGVFRFPKNSGGSIVFAKGDKAYWDAANLQATNVAGGNRYIGLVAAAAAGTDATVDVLVDGDAGQDMALLVAIAASAAVTNTVAETAFDQSFTIPANTLKAGDVIRVRLQGIATATNSTDTLNVKLKIGATAVMATGAVDVANNDIFFMDVDLVVRTVGAGGTLVAAGVNALGTEGTVTAKPGKLASTAIDTTVAQAVTVTATWSVANAGNSVRLDVFDAQLIRSK
jgi:predicted RecA/RadA family phage recombinase